jgi:hypothetical protein
MASQGAGARVWAIKPALFFRATAHKEDANVVRARAGLLNIYVVSAVVIQSIAYIETPYVDWSGVYPVAVSRMSFLFVDYALASLFGMAMSPFGMLGIVIVHHILNHPPAWKPARPMRFAWFLGSLMATCLLLTLVLIKNYKVAKPIILSIASMATGLTYLEGAADF